ncbi:hypothetical protein PAQ31011_02419 [Pandoraea aquatica]|uniref:Uncharacterized protein n=1 Tax=Pandoraea aquatica TaxID=2508290 RepID=A0A5E4V3V0_9BURK|nr:hypothetical protein [Pandoraea aquatica]VVE06453.1 hypothetical protein PAQ31011_02419 [Pandoraea aquatica]
MINLNETYRGCRILIEICGQAETWAITISVNPLDGVELIEPLGSRNMKLPKSEPLDLIVRELLREIRLAIDSDIVDP